MAAKNEGCDPRVIYNLMQTQRTWTEKVEFLGDMIEECCANSSSKSKGKKKRKINSWQCYLKHCAKEKSFKECISDKKRKEKEYEPNKEFYKMEAENDCPME